MDFWKVDWGKDEARGDEKLLDYFYPIRGYDEILTGKKRYVVGRKGMGKTAVCERLRLEAKQRDSWHTSTLSLRGFPLTSLRALRIRGFQDKSQYTPVWSFLIATEFARLVVSDVDKCEPKHIMSDLMRFISKNFPFGWMADTLQVLDECRGMVQLVESWFSPEAKHDNWVSVRFNRALPWLMQQLQKVVSNSTYFLLMDELDEGYSAGDSNLRLVLLALLRATEEFSIAIRSSAPTLQFRPLLVLRSDIYDNLLDNDLNKYDDAVIRLRWNASPSAAYSLRDVVDARVKASLDAGTIRVPWHQIAYDNDPSMPPKVRTLWSYLTNRTFERPRDILKFLKLCQQIPASGKLTFKVAREAENDYSEWFYNELRDEFQAHLSVWSEALSCITKLGRGFITVDELRKELSRDPVISTWLSQQNQTPDFIINKLFDFGVLGNLSLNNTWLFKYKDHSLRWNPNSNLIVHYGFHKKFRLRPRSHFV